jgi:hypothetical protein
MFGNDFNLTARQIAEMIHSVTSKIPRMDGSIVNSWHELTEEEQNLAENAVKKLYSEPLQTAEEHHELWMYLKLSDGWKLGDFDAENKTHPCLIQFNDLPPSEICKDMIWQNLIETFKQFYKK